MRQDSRLAPLAPVVVPVTEPDEPDSPAVNGPLVWVDMKGVGMPKLEKLNMLNALMDGSRVIPSRKRISQLNSRRHGQHQKRNHAQGHNSKAEADRKAIEAAKE